MLFWSALFKVKLCLLSGTVVLMQSTGTLWHECRREGKMKAGLGWGDIAVHIHISGKTFNRSDASLRERDLCLSGHGCQRWNKVFRLWIRKSPWLSQRTVRYALTQKQTHPNVLCFSPVWSRTWFTLIARSEGKMLLSKGTSNARL